MHTAPEVATVIDSTKNNYKAHPHDVDDQMTPYLFKPYLIVVIVHLRIRMSNLTTHAQSRQRIQPLVSGVLSVLGAKEKDNES